MTAHRSERGSHGKAAFCSLECVECSWGIWQERRGRIRARVSRDLEGGMFVSEEEPCPSRGSLLTATVCTLQRGIPRQASSGNCFPSGLALLSTPKAWLCSGSLSRLQRLQTCAPLCLCLCPGLHQTLSEQVKPAVPYLDPTHCTCSGHPFTTFSSFLS